MDSSGEPTNNDVRDNRAAVTAALELFDPMYEHLRVINWSGRRNETFDLIRAAALRRQREALSAALSMSEHGHGHFAVTLLRPAYEEMAWLEYLVQNKLFADEFCLLLSNEEMTTSLAAQNQYLGAKGMAHLGFSQKWTKARLAEGRETSARLREIGRRLGWRQGANLPTLAFVAKKIGREREYDFLYHGTSRFVHFSTAELMRRIWGRPGRVEIASYRFSKYWEDFALFWLFRTFIHTLKSCEDLLHEFEDPAANDRLEKIKETINGPVPILTKIELEWPFPLSEQR